MLGVEVPLRELFARPVLADFAAVVAAAAPATLPPMTPGAGSRQDLPLSFAQQRLWFLHQLEPESAIYNCPGALRLNGRLDVGALERTLSEIVRRHEVLRTRFVSVEGRPVQVISPMQRLDLPVTELSALGAEEQEAEVERVSREEARRPFDLEKGPLLRAGLLRLGEQEHVLLLTMHHIVSDAWSLGVLVRELRCCTRPTRSGRPTPLVELPIQYADYAMWEREWLQGEVWRSSLRTGRSSWRGARQCWSCPLIERGPRCRTFRGDRQRRCGWIQDLTRELKKLSQRQGVTLFMMLLAAWPTLLGRSQGKRTSW